LAINEAPIEYLFSGNQLERGQVSIFAG
jgi:hypothetical protein